MSHEAATKTMAVLIENMMLAYGNWTRITQREYNRRRAEEDIQDHEFPERIAWKKAESRAMAYFDSCYLGGLISIRRELQAEVDQTKRLDNDDPWFSGRAHGLQIALDMVSGILEDAFPAGREAGHDQV